MSNKPRAVRFSEQEEKEIQKFLKMNPLLDFSTLARMAIGQFMKDPKFEMTPLNNNLVKKKEKDLSSYTQ
jgi:hypothetical protein